MLKKVILVLKCVFEILKDKKGEKLCLNKVDLQHKLLKIFIDILRGLVEIIGFNLHLNHFSSFLGNNLSK